MSDYNLDFRAIEEDILNAIENDDLPTNDITGLMNISKKDDAIAIAEELNEHFDDYVFTVSSLRISADIYKKI